MIIVFLPSISTLPYIARSRIPPRLFSRSRDQEKKSFLRYPLRQQSDRPPLSAVASEEKERGLERVPLFCITSTMIGPAARIGEDSGPPSSSLPVPFLFGPSTPPNSSGG